MLRQNPDRYKVNFSVYMIVFVTFFNTYNTVDNILKQLKAVRFTSNANISSINTDKNWYYTHHVTSAAARL